MTYDLLMPKLGLTMTEGSITVWKASPGDQVRTGDVLLVIETDKVSYDVESEKTGLLVEIVVPAGETVPVGTVLARIGLGADDDQHARSNAARPAQSAPAPPPPNPSSAFPAASASPGSPPAPLVDSVPGSRRIAASPLARKRAAAAGLSLSAIAGTGPRGRIKASDVETATRAAAPERATAPGGARAGTRRRRPSPAQAVMARRLAEVKNAVPHFYLAAEAEVSALQLLRAAPRQDQGRPRATLTTFIVAAVARALTAIPEANTVWVEGELVTYGDADVGIAVHSPQGLYVPILRDAGRKPIELIAHESQALAERARRGELAADEMAGGAMTVSNAGTRNVTYMTPIIAPGQSAILGVGSLRKVFRPDAEGRPALRQELGLVLAADHRVFDGVSALQVLGRIIEYLESPERLLCP